MIGRAELGKICPISFGPFRLRPQERILERGGRQIRVGGRALDILIALTERPGDVVGQRELTARAWPNMDVSEAALRVQVRALRKALEDGESDARYIANIPGRGYCFVASIIGQSDETIARGEFDPPASERAPSDYPTNLPRRLGRLIGREAELAALERLVGQSRLVTIAGAGGNGKSRLSLDLGWRASSRFPDGVWLVDLAPLTRDDLVAGAIAAVLGAKIPSAESAKQDLAAAIRGRRALLIFDNCEHLAGPVAEMVEILLERAPTLSIVATSQGTIGVAGEQIYRLAPLAVPPSGVGDIVGYGAADYFIDRACQSDRRFVLDSDNAMIVAEICRRLDGIPLALEMAAARLPLLGLEGLRDGLDKRLRMLTADLPAGLGRHSTLRAMVEWTHSLLDAETGVAFRRLAVFPGAFSLDAAVAVIGGPHADYWDTVDLVGRLVNKCLVVVEPRDPPRYRLLETLRLFALERLAEHHEAALVGERHAAFFRDLFLGSYSAWELQSEENCLNTYGVEIDNVRAALDWSLSEPERYPIAIGLAGNAGLLWEALGHYAEARDYLDRALRLIDPEARTGDIARLLLQSGIAWRYVDPARAKDDLEQCIRICADVDEPMILASAQGRLGGVLTGMGRFDEASKLLIAAQKSFSDANYAVSEIGLIINFGVIAMQKQDFDEAEILYRRALSIARTIGKFSHVSLMLTFLSGLAFAKGDLARATELARQAVDIVTSNNSTLNLGARLGALSVFLILGGKLSEAREAIEQALHLPRTDGGVFASILQAGALLLVFEGQTMDAARLIGFVDHYYHVIGATRAMADQRTASVIKGMLKTTLSEDDIRSCAAEGVACTEDLAMELVLKWPGPTLGPILSAENA